MFMGETMRVTGKVARVYEEDGRGLVDLDVTGVQRDGIAVIHVTATVQLPHQGKPDEVAAQVIAC